MAAAFTRVPVILHGFYDAITYGVGNLLVAVFFGENRLEKFDLYFFPWAGEDAAFGQGIQGSFDGYRNDRDVEFATQYGKGLFKLTNVAGNRTGDRKSTRLNSSHVRISYAVFCLKKKK